MKSLFRLLLLSTGFLLHVFGLRKRASPELSAARLNHCQTKCPQVYDPLTGRCGTPGVKFKDPTSGKDRQVGCLCLMSGKKGKTTQKSADCWLAEVTNGERGWPEELRPKKK